MVCEKDKVALKNSQKMLKKVKLEIIVYKLEIIVVVIY